MHVHQGWQKGKKSAISSERKSWPWDLWFCQNAPQWDVDPLRAEKRTVSKARKSDMQSIREAYARKDVFSEALLIQFDMQVTDWHNRGFCLEWWPSG